MKHVNESQRRTEEMRRQLGNKAGFANGGRVKAYPDMTAGSLSGEGRKEKIKEYGGNAKKK